MKILYVEDNPTDADLTRRTLARDPHQELDHAATLADALARLDAGTPYDLLLADLRLPDGNGLTLLTEVRGRGLPMAVVILTGSGDQDAAVAALKAGADDYLVKRGDHLERLAPVLKAARARFLDESRRRGRPLRVLYAEHNAFDVDLTRRHLAAHALHVQLDVVADAEAVLDCLDRSAGQPPPYDVILLDYHLPGIDGLEAAKILLEERGTAIPLVLVTGQGSEEVAAQALRLGMADYLVKHPGYLYELLSTLEQAVRQAELNRERAALREARLRYEELTVRIPVGVYRIRVSAEDRLSFDYVSPRFCALLGVEEADVLADPGVAFAAAHPDDFPDLVAKNQAAREAGAPFDWEGRFLLRGQLRWVRIESRPTFLPSGDRLWDGVLIDVTERRQAEEAQRLNTAVIESTRDGVVITDLDANILTANRAFGEMTGYAEAELRGRNPRILKSGRQDPAFYQTLWASLLNKGHWQGEIWNRRKTGEIYPEWMSLSTVRDPEGRPTHYVAVHTDISRLKESERRLDHLAHHDPLTGLPNRLLVHSRLEHALERARRLGARCAVLYVDLDRFKTVNDSLGHPVGDELLAAVASRLQVRLRREDTLGRLGGDEFLVLLEHLKEPQEAALVARKLLKALADPFELSAVPAVYVSASIGISLFPDDSGDAAELVRNADAAMYQAKDQGRNTARFYTESLTRAANERLELETRLRRALEVGEMLLHYQPLVSVDDGRLDGVEALVRWQPPGEALLPPARFIPVAEETGLIVPLGEWVLRTACARVAAWRKQGLAIRTLAVNLSVQELRRPGVEARIRATLEATGLAPECLELEITESGLMQQGEQVDAILQGLKALGVRIAIDDFGTGYSSLAYLKRFPIDKLKIDRTFIRDIPADRNDMEIAATIIAMARSLGLEVLAEGVETPEQLEFLRGKGCDTYQGFLFSPPVPGDELERRFLRQP